MSTKRSIVLKGCPIVNEDGKATEAIKPGYLVKGVTSIAKQTSTTKVPKALALERDELGRGIDDTHKGSGTDAAAYAINDRVKVAVFAAGMEATVYVGSGANIVEDDLLESAGTGLFVEGSTNPIARAKETIGVVAVETALRVEFL